jgi:membrane-bound metal-dependent hydrolase YbcI (DUF457 family)
MPLPIGHALAGIALQQVHPGFFFSRPWRDALFFMFLANLPDLDFLPGIILGHPNLYHHGIFHSLGAALVVGAGIGWFFYRKQGHFWKFSAAVALVFVSHLVLDYFSLDFSIPYGLPFFWPLSNSYFIAAHPIFINIVRSGRSADFFSSMINLHNLDAALREIMILGGMAGAMGLLRRYREKRRLTK